MSEEERRFGDPKPDPSEPVEAPWRFVWIGVGLGVVFIGTILLLVWIFSR
jgi:hypothetical protein